MTIRDLSAARRIGELFKQSNDFGSVEDLLTDIIHYCNVEELDFRELLKQAEWYVNDENTKDLAELDEQANAAWDAD